MRRPLSLQMQDAAVAVALAEASPAMRAGLRAALPPPRFSVVAEAPARAALSLAGVDVLLVDERDPGALEPPPPGTALALLVREPTLAGLQTALAAGALGYVPRQIEAGRHAARRGGLTPRQSQVAALARRGHSTLEIAALLGLSQVTVRRHLSDAHAKRQDAGS